MKSINYTLNALSNEGYSIRFPNGPIARMELTGNDIRRKIMISLYHSHFDSIFNISSYNTIIDNKCHCVLDHNTSYFALGQFTTKRTTLLSKIIIIVDYELSIEIKYLILNKTVLYDIWENIIFKYLENKDVINIINALKESNI